ncbi:MAG: aldolase [Oscillospiraceae bacterium]|nr:aldolase [Oscillospiraceae bacterium]
MLKLMYITNRPDVAQIAESAGVDRIFVDMEYIGKAARQGGMDTVQNHHTTADIANVKKVLSSAEVLVRCNPINDYSQSEIDEAISNGADILMLPYFKTAHEVKSFIDMVGGMAKVMPLVETPEAVEVIDDILALKGIDEIFIGLNDLSLGYGKRFMFELLADGTVERLCLKFKQKGIPYGFGGIAALGKGVLPSEHVIKEHYRMGSTCVILSRSFYNLDKAEETEKIRAAFTSGVREIRELEAECEKYISYFTENEHEVERKIKMICAAM